MTNGVVTNGSIDEAVFDVTSTLGTALVVAVKMGMGLDAETLRAAIAREHEALHPEYGTVKVKALYGLCPVPDGMGVSQWVAISDVALRHRSFSWLMAQIATSKEVPGGMTEMPFASPVGMTLTNKATWETLVQNRGGMAQLAPPHGAFGSPMSVAGGTPGTVAPASLAARHTPAGGGSGTPARPLALAANFFGVGAGVNATGGQSLSRLGKRTAAQRAEDEDAMPPPDASRRRKEEEEKEEEEENEKEGDDEADEAAAAAAAEAALADGVAALFRHGGEASGTVPLRNVVFAKNLLTRNGFISAVEKLDTQSMTVLLPGVDRVVEQVRAVQAENAFDMFDDLLRRLEALNANAARARDALGKPRGSVVAPNDLANLLAVGVLCARVCKGGYKSRRSLPTRVTHALIEAMDMAPDRFGAVGRAVVEASLSVLGYDAGEGQRAQRPGGGQPPMSPSVLSSAGAMSVGAGAAEGAETGAPKPAEGAARPAPEDEEDGGDSDDSEKDSADGDESDDDSSDDSDADNSDDTGVESEGQDGNTAKGSEEGKKPAAGDVEMKDADAAAEEKKGGSSPSSSSGEEAADEAAAKSSSDDEAANSSSDDESGSDEEEEEEDVVKAAEEKKIESDAGSSSSSSDEDDDDDEESSSVDEDSSEEEGAEKKESEEDASSTDDDSSDEEDEKKTVDSESSSDDDSSDEEQDGDEVKENPSGPRNEPTAVSKAAPPLAAPALIKPKPEDEKRFKHLTESPGNLSKILKAATAKPKTSATSRAKLSTAPAHPTHAPPAGEAQAVSTKVRGRAATGATPVEPSASAGNKRGAKSAGGSKGGSARTASKAGGDDPSEGGKAAEVTSGGKAAKSKAAPSPSGPSEEGAAATPKKLTTKQKADAAAATAAALPPQAASDLKDVRCGNIEGKYIISENKVLFNGERLPPAKFEELSGVKTRRWKRSIKFIGEGKAVAIGEYLNKMGVDTSAGAGAPSRSK